MKDGNPVPPAGKDNTKSSQSRRRFIKNSSLLVAGAGVAHGLASGIANAAPPFGDETIRIGLIGCGGRGTGAASRAQTTVPPASRAGICV